MRELELLAPARDLSCGLAAIDHGADAVYIGARKFGARAAAGNSIDDIGRLCDYAHKFGARVYATCNTIVYDSELSALREEIKQLKAVGVDALLVQDMATLSMAEGISLHASTQCDIRTAEKVAWLRSLGFSRVVLARELSIDEIRSIHAAVPDVELEVFVHGALCVSFSGVCYASQYCFGRSANRGECAQFCRLRFNLHDADGREIVHGAHLLSLKDMCRIDNLDELAAAGVSSFKIEGRLKDAGYVKNVVSAYSQKLNEIISKHPDEYRRASYGRVDYHFEPNLSKTFNRGFTDYLLHGRSKDITSFDTPKAIGEPVGHVKEIRGRSFTVAGTASFANGDGLCFFNSRHELEGFRVNRAEGNRLFPMRMPQELRPGTILYRNHDEAFERILSGRTAERTIPVSMTFGLTEGGFSLTMRQIDGSACGESSIEFAHERSEKPQRANIERQLTKLGSTVYRCEQLQVEPRADEFFVPLSLLTDLRRRCLQELDKSMETHRIAQNGYEHRSKPLSASLKAVMSTAQSRYEQARKPSLAWQDEYRRYPYLYNIANQEAAKFYADNGLTDPQPAFELQPVANPLVMQCRHCLRYSLGFCVRRGGRRPAWREPLTLEMDDGRRFRLEFKCNECQMEIYAEQ